MHLARELAPAFRRLRRHPGFALSSLLTLGVGLGATVAMFAVVHAVVLNPLPYPASGRLVALDHSAPGIGNEGGLEMTQGLYLHYRESSRTLTALAIYEDVDVTLTGNDAPRRLTATVTTPELAGVLRVQPAVGRFLVEADAAPGASPVTVLSHALWAGTYGADPGVVGRTITLNGVGVEVVGVMPRGFAFPSPDTDLWLPRTINPATATFGSFTPSGVARLADGTDPAAAREELQELIPRLMERFPGSASREVVETAQLTAHVTPLREAVVGNVATTLWVLLGTVGVVLLIAAVNVTNLLTVRLEGRRHELAVRGALGAGPRNLRTYFLAEAAWLAGLSTAFAVVFATVALRVVRRYGPPTLPRLTEIGMTPEVLAAAAALGAAACLLLVLLPVVAGRRRDLAGALKQGPRATADRTRFRVRNGLIVAQTAFALVLVVGAGLMIRSFRQLTRVDTGFVADGVLTFQIALPATAYATRDETAAFHDALLARVRPLPGVERAGATTCLPLCRSWGGNPWAREDRPVAADAIPPIVATRRVSEDYFETMRLELVSGRTLDRRDREERTGAVVINRRAAAKLFPDRDPLGARIYPGTRPDTPAWYHVVGVVADEPVTTLTDDKAPTVYLPLLHADQSGPSPRLMSYAVRTSGSPLALVTLVRRAVAQLDPTLPVAYVRTMGEIERQARAPMAFTMVLLALMAGMALFLGVVGIYSVIAYMVAQRRAEFGIRLALGAREGDLTRMVLRQGGVLVAGGVVLGLGAALALTRFMRSMVFGVSTSDPATYGAVTVVLAAVAVLAIYRPARRAAGADPLESLRAE